MGPRSIDRGIADLVQQGGGELSASMGPRSIDRGILGSGCAVDESDAGFNGAAVD